MEFKSKRFVIILLSILISQFLFAENPKIVKASNNPIYGNLNLKLKKDLILGGEKEPYLFGTIRGVDVSDKYIYVFDPKMAKVRVYDLKGKFVRDIGRKGQGPGEFMAPSPFFLREDGEIYIYDIMARRMTIFNSEGNYKKNFEIEEGIFPRKFYVDEKGSIYITFEKPDYENLNMYINFGRLSPEGKLEKIFYKTFHIKIVPVKGGGIFIYDHPYLSYLYFTNTLEDNLALMDSMKYEIIFFSNNGDVFLKILKDEKSSKVTKEEKEIVASEGKSEWTRMMLLKYATFSERRPFSSNLLSDEKGRIYVERFKPLTDKSRTFSYDIFNGRGEYLYGLSLDFKIDLIKNGYIYTVSEEESGGIKIIRYKIENWKEIRF